MGVLTEGAPGAEGDLTAIPISDCQQRIGVSAVRTESIPAWPKRRPLYTAAEPSQPLPTRKAPMRSMMRSGSSLAAVSTTPTVRCRAGRTVFPDFRQA